MTPGEISVFISTRCHLSLYFTPWKIKLPKNSKRLNVIPNSRNKGKDKPNLV